LQAMSYMGQAQTPDQQSQQTTGVQYVVGTPPQTPVLRPLRQPLYDSEFLADGQSGTVSFFQDNKKFATGAQKQAVDTNMTQSGQLGYPLEFDLVGFLFELQRGATRLQSNSIYNSCVWQWFFGQNVPWLRAKLTKIPEGIAASGSVSTGTAQATEASIISNGWGVVTNFYNFTTPDRKARRISSTESFRMDLVISYALALGSNVSLKATAWMLGILYAQL
jgi:hypothetical protein